MTLSTPAFAGERLVHVETGRLRQANTPTLSMNLITEIGFET